MRTEKLLLRRQRVRTARLAIVLLVIVVSAGILRAVWIERGERRIRASLLSEIQPVALANCTLERFGDPSNAYLMCGNLLDHIQAAYSYGIAGEDSWGCQIARHHHVPVHQYDCFDNRRPRCEADTLRFHDECVEGAPKTDGSRSYDTIAGHLARNGDLGKRLVMKMDVEGAEWASILATPDEVLEDIDQLAVEFHGASRTQALDLVRKLKRTFFIVHLHFNNYACSNREPPFPAGAYQVSFVNKRIGVFDLAAAAPVLPSVLDTLDDPASPDCQAPPSARTGGVTP